LPISGADVATFAPQSAARVISYFLLETGAEICERRINFDAFSLLLLKERASALGIGMQCTQSVRGASGLRCISD